MKGRRFLVHPLPAVLCYDLPVQAVGALRLGFDPCTVMVPVLFDLIACIRKSYPCIRKCRAGDTVGIQVMVFGDPMCFTELLCNIPLRYGKCGLLCKFCRQKRDNLVQDRKSSVLFIQSLLLFVQFFLIPGILMFLFVALLAEPGQISDSIASTPAPWYDMVVFLDLMLAKQAGPILLGAHCRFHRSVSL